MVMQPPILTGNFILTYEYHSKLIKHNLIKLIGYLYALCTTLINTHLTITPITIYIYIQQIIYTVELG